jgi:HAD superfamily phosphatase (TIGR01668 family)
MLRRFYPKRLAPSSYDIDYEKLYREGYRGILFDIDNTLVEHGADATPRAIELFKRLKKIGFQTCLISNNSDERVRRFNKNIGANYIFKANKPFTKNYIKAIKIMGTRIDNTVFVGDQLFTDILGGNRLGCRTIWVKPLAAKEFIGTKITRQFEKLAVRLLQSKKML